MPEACWQLKAAVGQQEKSWGGKQVGEWKM